MKRRFLHWLGWRVAKLLYKAANPWQRLSPANLATRICDAMERNNLCCKRHGYEGKEKIN